MSALLAKLSASGNFQTVSRRLKLWGSVAPSDKPALFLKERADIYARASEATPETITLTVDLYIYTDIGADQTVTPSTTINELLDAVDTALKPDVLTGRQTLGNLVSHCWIEGKVMKDAGDIEGSGVAVVPVKILVPR